MSESVSKLKQHLRELIRNNKDLRQKEIADKVDISMGYLSQVLRGKRLGSYDLIRKIALACGTSIQEIEAKLAEEHSPSPQPNTVNETIIDFGAIKTNGLSHEDVITRFKDKTAAKEINYMLVEIEAEDQERFEDICDHIRTIYGKVAKRKANKDGTGTDRASGED